MPVATEVRSARGHATYSRSVVSSARHSQSALAQDLHCRLAVQSKLASRCVGHNRALYKGHWKQHAPLSRPILLRELPGRIPMQVPWLLPPLRRTQMFQAARKQLDGQHLPEDITMRSARGQARISALRLQVRNVQSQLLRRTCIAC